MSYWVGAAVVNACKWWLYTGLEKHLPKPAGPYNFALLKMIDQCPSHVHASMWIIRQWRWQSISLLIRKMQMQQSNNGLVSIFSFWLHFAENHNKTPLHTLLHFIKSVQHNFLRLKFPNWHADIDIGKRPNYPPDMHHRHRHRHACMYYQKNTEKWLCCRKKLRACGSYNHAIQGDMTM